MSIEEQLDKIQSVGKSICDYMGEPDIDNKHLLGMLRLQSKLQKTLLRELNSNLNELCTDAEIFAEGLQKIDDAIGCFSSLEGNSKANTLVEILHYILCNEETKTVQ